MTRSYPRLALYGFAVVVIVSVAVAASLSGTAFGSYNPSWDGTADFRTVLSDAADTDIAQRIDYYNETADPERTLAFIIAPQTRYSPSEARAIRSFVTAGGVVVVAGDFGTTTNQLLDEINASTRLVGVSLRDEQEYADAPSLPLATNVSNHSYTDGISQLTLNYPTALRVAPNATTLIGSSPYGYLDFNDNASLDASETLDSYPVVAVESLGAGQVVVSGDPSVFINTMLDRPDNRAFARNLAESRDRMVVDVSHSEGLPPLVWLVTTLRNSPLLAVAVGLVGLLAIARWRSLLGTVSAGFDTSETPPRRTPASVERSIRSRHPEWDDQRVERVAQTITSRHGKGDDDA